MPYTVWYRGGVIYRVLLSLCRWKCNASVTNSCFDDSNDDSIAAAIEDLKIVECTCRGFYCSFECDVTSVIQSLLFEIRVFLVAQVVKKFCANLILVF